MKSLVVDATGNDLTYRIIGAAMAVHNHIGPGYKEEVYENALAIELRQWEIAVEQQYPVPVIYEGEQAVLFYLDLFVEDQVVVEVKALSHQLKIMPLPNRIRYFNKHFLNRITSKIAGASHSPISLIQHTGRKSGKRYQTPVMVEPLEDGFMFALTYGPAVDWYRNVLAAGGCTLLWHGGKYQLEDPQTVPAKTGLQAFPPPSRQILAVMRIEHFFKMKFAVPDPKAERS